jgi:TonB family protein
MRHACALAAGAAALLLASAATADVRNVEAYLARAEAQAEQRLGQAGLDADRTPLQVRATVGGDGRLNGFRVVRSSGSLETDEKARKALHLLRVAAPPAELAGRQVTLTLGEASPVLAGTP